MGQLSELMFLMTTVVGTVIAAVLLYFMLPYTHSIQQQHIKPLNWWKQPIYYLPASQFTDCYYSHFNEITVSGQNTPCAMGFASTVLIPRNDRNVTVETTYNVRAQANAIAYFDYPTLDQSCYDDQGNVLTLGYCDTTNSSGSLNFTLYLATNQSSTTAWQYMTASKYTRADHFYGIERLAWELTQYNNLANSQISNDTNIGSIIATFSTLQITISDNDDSVNMSSWAEAVARCNENVTLTCNEAQKENDWTHLLRAFSYTFFIEIVIIIVYASILAFHLVRKKGNIVQAIGSKIKGKKSKHVKQEDTTVPPWLQDPNSNHNQNNQNNNNDPQQMSTEKSQLLSQHQV